MASAISSEDFSNDSAEEYSQALSRWLALGFGPRQFRSESAQSYFPFDHLLRELQYMIWREVVIRREPIHPYLSQCEQRVGEEHRMARLFSHAPILVKKEWKQECSNIYFQENTFYLEIGRA